MIEGGSEEMKMKKEMFERVDEFAGDERIFARNRCSLWMRELGGVRKRGEKVIGMDFTNAVRVMKLVQV
ncbi:3-hydroxyacyl-CoA dehydrogenase NAD-binding domain-containing protein, partial [Bacillus altitudinis]|uniref:3-hydroxyacyl-CoA dehydrogenase NAD-binding domain-containing protein n=1 Tax=Bacillus altitudinis TaxID=293387 RepID=UPI001F239172